ncbi:hypothetical protein RchiOBHm_Chr2g0118721 [Rosa chinensis]|uniref:Uncharacterized protein n=1 Tax=Rosa chinensis TaxID=74649 RepID=A0A2P6RRV0_ROSCH|nr:hypothetical protein RchiOBHm_Chr2g0118721 [Rosa chinensis]
MRGGRIEGLKFKVTIPESDSTFPLIVEDEVPTHRSTRILTLGYHALRFQCPVCRVAGSA